MRFKSRRPAVSLRSQSTSRLSRRHSSTLEVLEGRAMLAGNPIVPVTAAFQNSLVAQDVNHDGHVSAVDLLLVVDDLMIHGPHTLTAPKSGSTPTATPAASSSSTEYLDVNGDYRVSALDVMGVVDALAIGDVTQPLIVTTVIKDMSGNVITTPITVGTQFKVEVDVQDNRNPVAQLPGVFSTYVNMTYDASVSTVDNGGTQVPVAGSGFGIFGSGSGPKPLDTTSVANQITDEGAFSLGGNPATPVVQTLFTFTATATHSGTVMYTPFFDDIANHETLLFGNPTPLLSTEVFFAAASVQVVDAPQLSLSPGPSINQASTGTTNFVFTVSLSQDPAAGAPVTVKYSTADGIGTNPATVADGDYVATTGFLTFSAGNPLSQLVTVVVNATTVVEPPETFRLIISDPVNALLSPNSAATGTILNDSISIDDVTLTRSATDTNATFTVHLSTAPTVAVNVNYNVTPDTATLNTDYRTPIVNGVAAVSGTLTFAPNVTTQVITVPIIGSSLPDIEKDFHISLTNPVNAILDDGQATGTIDPLVTRPSLSITPQVTLAPTGVPFTPFVFTVTLSHKVDAEDLHVFFTTVDGSATAAGGDYTATSGTLTFLAGSTTQTITVQVPPNSVAGPNESFSVKLTPVEPDVTGTPSGTGTIVTQHGTPVLTVTNPTVAPGAVGTTAFFTVSLDFPVDTTVTVPYATADNTAFANSDYLAVSGNLTFNPGDQSLTRVIPVTVLGQTGPSADESFFLNLSTPSPPTGISLANSRAVATIIRQGILISDASAAPGGNAVFTVTLTRAQDQQVTVPFTTADGTASASNGDYTATSGQVTFAANSTAPQFITVPIPATTATGPNETFFVNLGTATGNVQVLSGHGTGTILNLQGQRAAVTLKITDLQGNTLTSLNQNQNFLLRAYVQDTQPVPTGIFQAYLNEIYDSRLVSITPGGSITFGEIVNNVQTFQNGHSGSLATAGQVIDAGAFQIAQPDPALRGQPQLLFSVPLTAKNFGLATFSVGPSPEPLHDIQEFITNNVPVESVNFVNSAANPLSINIGTNVFAVSNVTTTVGGAGTTAQMVFAVTRFLPTSTPATVVVSTSDGTAHAVPGGDDYVPRLINSTPLTFSGTGASETQFITILALGSATVEPPETFNVNLSSPTGAQASTVPGIGTIVSAFPPKLSIADAHKSEGEPVVFTVTLSAPSSQTTTVQFATAVTSGSNAAVPGVNFTPTSGVLIFAPGTTQQTFSVATKYVNAQTVAETFKVVLSNPSNADLLTTPLEAIGTIDVIPPAAIKGFVFVDLANLGVKDANEAGIANVVITATRSTGEQTTTMTKQDGSFAFTTLQPGTYSIKESSPGFFLDGGDWFHGVKSATNDLFTGIVANSATTSGDYLFGEQGLIAPFAATFLNRRAYFASSVVTGILGSQMNPTSLNLLNGDAYVSFDNGLPGLNVIQALYNPALGSVSMTLSVLNAQNQLVQVASSTSSAAGVEQITFTGVATQPYFLHIVGSNSSVKLQISGAGTSTSVQPAAIAVSPPSASVQAAATVSAATDAAMNDEPDWVLARLMG